MTNASTDNTVRGVFPPRCLPCSMVRNTTLSSSAEAAVTPPLGSSCQHPGAPVPQRHRRLRLRTTRKRPPQKEMRMGIRLNPRIQLLPRSQSHRKKFSMNCAERILNDGGRASESFLHYNRGAKQRICARGNSKRLETSNDPQRIYGFADLVCICNGAAVCERTCIFAIANTPEQKPYARATPRATAARMVETINKIIGGFPPA